MDRILVPYTNAFKVLHNLNLSSVFMNEMQTSFPSWNSANPSNLTSLKIFCCPAGHNVTQVAHLCITCLKRPAHFHRNNWKGAGTDGVCTRPYCFFHLISDIVPVTLLKRLSPLTDEPAQMQPLQPLSQQAQRPESPADTLTCISAFFSSRYFKSELWQTPQDLSVF